MGDSDECRDGAFHSLEVGKRGCTRSVGCDVGWSSISLTALRPQALRFYGMKIVRSVSDSDGVQQQNSNQSYHSI